MGPIEDIAVGTTEDGEQRLRFAATIVNIGEGPLLVRAQRPPFGVGPVGASTSGSRSATAAGTRSARPAPTSSSAATGTITGTSSRSRSTSWRRSTGRSSAGW